MKLAEVPSLIPIILVLQWKIIMLIAFPKIEVFFQDTNYNFFFLSCLKLFIVMKVARKIH